MNIFKIDTADTKPVAKLVETVWSDLYKPYGIRREAKAKAEARLIEVQGEIEVQGLLATLEDRAATRQSLTELRRQQNQESIVQGSIQYLPESVSDEKVDPDWTVQFFNACQDVSNEEMQSLWSKILAGEVARPRAYSLRTLDVVRKLRRSDAEMFTAFCAFVSNVDHQSSMGYFLSDQARVHIRSRGLDCALQLDALGLMQASDNITVLFDDDRPKVVTYYDQSVRIWPFSGIDVYPLTDSGNELFAICGSKKDDTYWSLLLDDWKKRGMTIEPIS